MLCENLGEYLSEESVCGQNRHLFHSIIPHLKVIIEDYVMN